MSRYRSLGRWVVAGFLLAGDWGLAAGSAEPRGPVYVLDKTDEDPDGLSAKDLGVGQRMSASLSSVTMNYSVWGPAHFTFMVGGTPPAVLRPGDSFKMTIQATGEWRKPSADAVLRNEPNASCNIGVAGGLEISATPHGGGFKIAGEWSTSTCAGNYGIEGATERQWIASDSRTYTIRLPPGGGGGAQPPAIGCYIAGFGTFARYTYRRLPADEEPPKAAEEEEAGGEDVWGAEDEEAGPLEVLLGPPAVDVTAGGELAETVLYVMGGNLGRQDKLTVGAVDEAIVVRPMTAGEGALRSAEPAAGLRMYPLRVSARLDAAPREVLVPVTVDQPGGGTVCVTLHVGVNPPPMQAVSAGPGAEGVVRGAEPAGDDGGGGVREAARMPPARAARGNSEGERLVARAAELAADGRAKEGAELYREAMARNATDAGLRARFGAFCIDEEWWQEAVAVYAEACRLAPQEPMHRAERAYALLQAGRRAEAEKDAKEALRLGASPTDHAVFEDLGLQP